MSLDTSQMQQNAQDEDVYTTLVRQQAIDYIFQNVMPAIVGMILMPIVIGFLFFGKVDTVTLVAWVAFVFSAALFRYLLCRKYAQLPAHHQQHNQYIDWFTLTSLLSGVAWAFASVFFFLHGHLPEQVILYVCIIGLTAGSLIFTSYWLPAFYAYAIPSTVTAALFLFTQTELAYKGLAILILMYFGIVSSTAKSQNKTVLQAIRLRFENLDLVEQLKIQKASAEKASVDKSRFLAAASHDLRQPLHALQLYFSSLNFNKNLQQQPKTLIGIQNSMATLNGLFNTLLDISRLDAGLLKPQIQDFYLKDIFQVLEKEFEYQAIQKGLKWHSEAGELIVRTDVFSLETILRNLVSNAIRYTPSGQVALTAYLIEKKDMPFVQICVRDTGIGIAEQHREAIFDEYFQVGNSERDKAKGLGLGLAIVARLVKLLDLKITLWSSLGKGSSFFVDVPIGSRPVRVHQPEMPASEDESFQNMRILLIDDEAIVRESMAQLLEKWGCNVVAVESEEEAKAVVFNQPWQPDVIMADYRLREQKTGAQAIQAVFAVMGMQKPALLITGDTAPERLQEAKNAGFLLLHKPVSLPKLKVFLRQCYKQLQPIADA